MVIRNSLLIIGAALLLTGCLNKTKPGKFGQGNGLR